MEAFMPNPNRKTDCRFVTTHSGLFASRQEATRFADSLKMWLERYAKRHGDYAILAIIAISQNDARHGAVLPQHTSRRGRPSKVFTPNNEENVGMACPHIHIVLVANPCDTIRKDLQRYLNGKFERMSGECGGNVNVSNVYDIDGLLSYVLSQSVSVRTVEINPLGILNKTNDSGLFTALEKSKSAHKIRFGSLDCELTACEGISDGTILSAGSFCVDISFEPCWDLSLGEDQAYVSEVYRSLVRADQTIRPP
jgi:hypothetical protein